MVTENRKAYKHQQGPLNSPSDDAIYVTQTQADRGMDAENIIKA